MAASEYAFFSSKEEHFLIAWMVSKGKEVLTESHDEEPIGVFIEVLVVSLVSPHVHQVVRRVVPLRRAQGVAQQTVGAVKAPVLCRRKSSQTWA